MKKILSILLILIVVFAIIIYMPRKEESEITPGAESEAALDDIIQKKLAQIEEDGLDVRIAGKSLGSFGYNIRLDEKAEILAPEDFLEDIMCCSVNVYSDGRVELDRSETELKFAAKDVQNIEEVLYIPISAYLSQLGYEVKYNLVTGMVDFTNTDGGDYLPKAYDMREHDRVTPVRNQGTYGTCWAFASLGALESISLPKEEKIYSVDHMSMNNGFSLDLSEGGEHTMSLAYLASWEGPVLESDDEYGDGETNTELTAVKHLKEAIIIDDRDEEKIKSAIYKYGGVETSIYMEMSYGDFISEYYNSDTSCYYYNGTEKPNHDLVVVGWDDDYPKENFTPEPSRNGAYICKNSWGEEFGDKGYFYVSYDDVNICGKSIVYTKLAEPDNYDNIYQSDLLGWVGQMGFDKEEAYFANVYTAENDEILKAVSFYATGPNTKFSVYVVTNYEDMSSLNGGRQQIGKGETRYAGYYTVDLKRDIELKKGQKYAIIVSVNTPGSERPIAIECDGGERTANLDLTDGEGYVSLYGEVWYSAEESDTNVCLKAFTDNQ
ncbi:Cysteine protease, C1A family [Lachnospiraceae bacterium NE2001]|nr:Cysteine protease, C1A family [Lachnospiraceae bacterium NE2001]